MAVVQITGEVTNDVIKAEQTPLVFVRPVWTDNPFDWIWVPYLDAVSCEYRAAPGVSSAELLWRVGDIKQNYDEGFSQYPLLNLADLFVAIGISNSYKDWVAWVGLIQNETITSPTVDSDGYTTADQTFGAVGLEHLLRRRRIIGSYVDGDILIDRTLTFNKRHARGTSILGNRSTARGSFSSFTFSNDGNLWTNLDILEYLLSFFQPPGVSFPLFGAHVALDQIVEVHDFNGLTVYDAINRLVDRRRGFGWAVRTSLIHTQIYITTQLSEPITLGEVVIPANPYQRDLDLTGLLDVEATLHATRAHLVDTIVVRGNRPAACTSLAFSNSSLVEGWTAGAQIVYENDTDEERRGDTKERCYRHYRVPGGWGWQLANLFDETAEYLSPFTNADGTVDHTANGATFENDHQFEAWLPFEVTGGDDTDASREIHYRRPFVLIEDPDIPGEYHYVDALDRLGFSSASLSIADRELSLILRPAGAPPHVLGLNNFTESAPTDNDPEVDYTTMVATVVVRGDSVLHVTVSIPENDLAGLGKTMVIDVPQADYWFAAGGTILDVDANKAFVYNNSGLIETLRDDGGLLRSIAVAALAWYGTQRNTIEFKFRGLTPQIPPGVLIRLAASSAYSYERIGTTVTSWRLDFGLTPTTTVKTGFAELDIQGAI